MVPTMGISQFSGVDNYYQADSVGVCQGSAAFTVLCALQVIETYNDAGRPVVGNFSTAPASGWILERLIDANGEANFGWIVNTTGITQLGTPMPLTMLQGRTALLALTVSDATGGIDAYINGAFYDHADYDGGLAYVLATGAARFGIGNSNAAVTNGSLDRIIAFGYVDQALNASQMATLWNTFRKTSSLRVAGEGIGGFDYSYEAVDLAQPPQRFAPASWVNGGSVAGGALAWQGAATDQVVFTVDQDPDFSVTTLPAG